MNLRWDDYKLCWIMERIDSLKARCHIHPPLENRENEPGTLTTPHPICPSYPSQLWSGYTHTSRTRHQLVLPHPYSDGCSEPGPRPWWYYCCCCLSIPLPLPAVDECGWKTGALVRMLISCLPSCQCIDSADLQGICISDATFCHIWSLNLGVMLVFVSGYWRKG